MIGKFEIGDSHEYTGIIGRKIIVNTYEGYARRDGGVFSGNTGNVALKSTEAHTIARYILKNIIAEGFAEKCEIQLSYAIVLAIRHPSCLTLSKRC